MEEIKRTPCIVCPVGCSLKITIKDGKVEKVEGNKCARGVKYGESEVLNPVRTITSTVRVKDGIHNVCPIRTDGEIPKNLIFDCMKEINKVRVDAPIKAGQVIIENVLDTGINIISSRELKKKQ